jgi:LysM repeat protein
MTLDYTVKSGDTLYSIAHGHHTTIRELLEANGLERGALIKAGQSLNVPVNTYFPAKKDLLPTQQKLASAELQESKPTEYTVQNGDTLYTIAHSHHISISSLLHANGLDMKAVIKVGQKLSLPSGTILPGKSAVRKNTPDNKTTVSSSAGGHRLSPKSSKGTYVVQRGDTLFSVARKNHIVISRLMKLNKIKLGNALHIGQVLRVSGSNTYIASTKVHQAVEQPNKKVKHETKLPVGAMPSYTVKRGDTLWHIAREHHLTLAQIRKMNKMHRKDRIHTGMVLAVGKAVEPKPKIYKVKKGDTLWLIAKKNGMKTKELRKLNHMHRKDRIHTGMVLALSDDAVLPTAKNNEKTNIKKEKKHKVKTPLRIATKKKSRKSAHSRFSSAASILNGRSGGRKTNWSGGNKVVRIAKRYLGRHYVWGAVGPHTFDCSGFTQYVMRKSKGVTLPRVSRRQAYYGKYISRSHLRPGDLIFFDTSHRRRGYVNHVAIYIGNHKFIHASSARHRVVITSLDRPFYSARFKWGRRVN